MTIRTHGAAQTALAGRVVGELLRGGDVLALSGPLGAGKTQFVKGVAAGLGVGGDEPVVSPTFVLIREYAGRLRLCHIDAYRLSGAQELLALGIEELVGDARAVVAVEWADRVAEALPESAVRLEFEHAGVEVRAIHVAADVPAHFSGLADRLAAAGLAPEA